MLEIDIRLFATLARHMPAEAEHYRINPGITVGQLLVELQVPAAEAKLIFINGVQARIETPLFGGERVGIFPPVGGG